MEFKILSKFLYMKLFLLIIIVIFIYFYKIKETYLYNRYARYNLDRSYESNQYSVVYFPQLDRQTWLRTYDSK